MAMIAPAPISVQSHPADDVRIDRLFLLLAEAPDDDFSFPGATCPICLGCAQSLATIAEERSGYCPDCQGLALPPSDDFELRGPTAEDRQWAAAHLNVDHDADARACDRRTEETTFSSFDWHFENGDHEAMLIVESDKFDREVWS